MAGSKYFPAGPAGPTDEAATKQCRNHDPNCCLWGALRILGCPCRWDFPRTCESAKPRAHGAYRVGIFFVEDYLCCS